MKEVIKSFIIAANRQEHILPLIRQADFHVNLSTGQESIQLKITRGRIEICESEASGGYSIEGSPAEMSKLLNGEEKLRVLERGGILRVSAPLRIVLLLEALFLLANAQNFAKIS
jgi:hypothetical protein